MIKSVTYSVVPRKNPGNKEEPAKFYAQAQCKGEADVRSMAAQIERMCSMTFSDIVGVLSALESTVRDSLANSEIVRLGGLGSLRLTLSSKGSSMKEDFNPAFIKRAHIVFTPGIALAGLLQTLNFERVDVKKKEKEQAPDTSVDEEGALGA